MSSKLETSLNGLSTIEVGMTLYWIPDVTFDYDQMLLKCTPVKVQVFSVSPPHHVYCISVDRPTDNPAPCSIDRFYPTVQAAWERVASKLKPIVDDANKALYNARAKAKEF